MGMLSAVVDVVQSHSYLVFLSGSLLTVGSLRLFTETAEFRRNRKLRETPVEDIGTVSEGRTSVSGEAQPLDGPVVAPFTEEECIAVEWEIAEYSADEIGSGRWNTYATGRQFPVFALENGPRSVSVAPSGATLRAEPSDVRQFRPSEDLPESVRTFLDEEGLSERDGDRRGDSPVRGERRYVERRIEAGDELFVYGEAIPENELEVPTVPGGTVIHDQGGEFPGFLVAQQSRDELLDEMDDSKRSVVVGAFLTLAGVLGFLTVLYLETVA